MTEPPLKIVLHAPTAGALARARSNLANLNNTSPAPEVRIVVNAEAVAAALDNPNGMADRLTLVCANTLRKLGREARPPLTVRAEDAVLGLAARELEGWPYIRA